MFQNWSNITLYSLQKLWEGFLSFIPALIVAIVVFIAGWFVAILIGKLITGILKKLKFNKALEKGSWDESLAKANIKVDASEFIGAIVKWILVIVFLQVAVSILGWMQFAGILGSVVAYLPNVIIATLIFAVTVIIADIVEKVVRVSTERVKIGYGQMISAIVKWAIWIFAIIIILEQLNIGGSIPAIVVQGIVGFFALAGGLAFGLGGRDAAAEIIKDLRQKFSQK
ncbi:MAG: hypothetical protein ABH813_01990 [Patescibacteria group bacterium]